MPHVAPYGSWKSPITSDLIVSRSIGLSAILPDGQDTYWGEGRPSEGGRIAIVRRTPDGTTTDIIPPPFNARSRVHEYGGGSFVVENGSIYFSNFADNRLYYMRPGSEPQPITPEAPLRYADMIVDRRRNRLICVREDHTTSSREAVNTLVSITLEGDVQGGTIVVSGNDFYSSPRLSPDGSRLAWLTWNHPNMPWDGTELWVGELDAAGFVTRETRVAGGLTESISQPEWSPAGVLHFISDRTGWWNLYRLHNGEVQALCKKDAEFSGPQWVFGLSTYQFVSASHVEDPSLICWYGEEGIGHLAHLNTSTGELSPIETPY